MLQCFLDHVSGCEDNTVVKLALFNLEYTMTTFESICSTEIKPSCDTEQEVAGCDLSAVEDCINLLQSADHNRFCM